MLTRSLTTLAALAALTAGGANADIIAIEDFDGGTPSWTNDIASQTFVDPNSSNQGLFIQAASTDNANFSGNSAFGQDLAGESGEPTLDPFVFTFSNVDVSLYEDIFLSFDFAAFANADAGSYIVVIDGVDQAAVEFFNDPDSAVLSDTISVNIGTASTVGLRVTGTLNGGSDTLELDNFVLEGALTPEPGSLALLGLGGLMIARRRRG